MLFICIYYYYQNGTYELDFHVVDLTLDLKTNKTVHFLIAIFHGMPTYMYISNIIS